MKKLFQTTIIVLICSVYYPAAVQCQTNMAATPSGNQHPGGLFEEDEVLDITFSGNLKALIYDRFDKAKNHPVQLQYYNDDSSVVNLSTEMKTRGHFRKLRENCTYPPLSINFIKSDTLNASLFKEQRKLKLVMPCQGDQYIIREWLAYKIYNLVTPLSFKTRLVRIKLTDSKSKKSTSPFLGMLLEEEEQMAKRNKTRPVTRKLNPEQTNASAFLKMAVFEYLIGNTDWSVQYLQNTKLVAEDSTAVAIVVPYDFDHAGIVATPYAKPPEALELSSVRERRYRGFCIRNMNDFNEAVTLFNRLKNDIYSLYSNCKLIDEKFRASTIRYLNEFYETINNPESLAKEFGYPCDRQGTGHIVIKGMRKD